MMAVTPAIGVVRKGADCVVILDHGEMVWMRLYHSSSDLRTVRARVFPSKIFSRWTSRGCLLAGAFGPPGWLLSRTCA